MTTKPKAASTYMNTFESQSLVDWPGIFRFGIELLTFLPETIFGSKGS
jgi:hypothetical protein